MSFISLPVQRTLSRKIAPVTAPKWAPGIATASVGTCRQCHYEQKQRPDFIYSDKLQLQVHSILATWWKGSVKACNHAVNIELFLVCNCLWCIYSITFLLSLLISCTQWHTISRGYPETPFSQGMKKKIIARIKITTRDCGGAVAGYTR